MSRIISVDPGRSKCGLVLVDCERDRVLQGEVIATEAVLDTLQCWRQLAPVERLVLGNGTASESLRNQLPADLPIKLVDEHGTTLQARKTHEPFFSRNEGFNGLLGDINNEIDFFRCDGKVWCVP